MYRIPEEATKHLPYALRAVAAEFNGERIESTLDCPPGKVVLRYDSTDHASIHGDAAREEYAFTPADAFQEGW